MEAVGARLGRSSSRYGTTSVFSGPVRKWKKDWVPISSTPKKSNTNTNNSNTNTNGGGGGGGVTRLSLFKWTPLGNGNINKKFKNNNEVDDVDVDDESGGDVGSSLEPLKKKFKYIPVAVLEKQSKEAEENSDDETKPAEQGSKRGVHDVKPDINDIPMDDNGAIQVNLRAAGQGRQDLNESLDLSLGWTSHEEGNGSDSQTDPDG